MANRRVTPNWQYHQKIGMLVRLSGFPISVHEKCLQLNMQTMELLMISIKDQNPAIEVHRPSTDQAVHPSSQNNGPIGSTDGGNLSVDDRTNAKSTNGDDEPETVTTIAATGKLLEGEGNTDANAENGLACSVCTDDFTKGQDVRVLPCNHKFHPGAYIQLVAVQIGLLRGKLDSDIVGRMYRSLAVERIWNVSIMVGIYLTS